MKSHLLALCSLSVISALALSGVVDAADHKLSSKVVYSKSKLSKRLIDVARPLPVLNDAKKQKMLASGEKVPGIDVIYEVPNQNFPFAKEYMEKKKKSALKDSVLQSHHNSGVNAKQSLSNITMGFGFDGMPNVMGVAPPDTNADVGPNHIVQTVNTALAIWDKSGNQLLAPVAINSLWAEFGGLCDTTNRGDPIVLYDSQADRWLISQFAFPAGFTDNRQCIAISQTGDPTGAYYLYDFPYSTTKFNDYPHYGVWTDGYYSGVNQFSSGDLSFVGSGVVAYERDKMLQGQTAQQIIFDLEDAFPNSFTPMPADIDGVVLPPVDMPAPFIMAGADIDTMDIFSFKVDWDTPENSTFELTTTVPVAPYNGAVCDYDRNCVKQKGTTQELDAIAFRMMFRAAYRNLNGTHKLVANHTVVGSDTSDEIAGVRWYEFDLTDDGQASLVNNGTYNLDDGNSRWMGSAAMDAVGNIGVAYSVSGPELYPSIRFSGRLSNDPVNMLTVPEQELLAGGGSQSGLSRWGDYSSLSIDPSDDCTMWYSTEYYKAENDNSTGWSTYIGSFKFNNCEAGPTGEVAGTIVSEEDSLPLANALVTIGALTVVTDENGHYSGILPAGNSYDISAYKYGWLASTPTNVDVQDDQIVTVNLSIAAAEPITVTGVVSDGSSLGNPLYASILVSAPGATIEANTDPVTGHYSIDLFEGTLVKLSVEALVDGYIQQSIDLMPESSPVLNFGLIITESCIADGYILQSGGLIEKFEGTIPPEGWTVVNTGDGSEIWKTTNDTFRGNLLGTGDAMIIDSDAGSFSTTAGTLTSPVIEVALLTNQTLEFASLFRTFSGGDVYNVEISLDGNEWTAMYAMDATNTSTIISIDLAPYLIGVTTFQVRWNYSAYYEYYAIIDDVKIGLSECVVRNGSFIYGLVTDANTGLALNGVAIVAGVDSTMSQATPEDSNIADGYFSLFVDETISEVNVNFSPYATVDIALSAFGMANPVELEVGQLVMPDEINTIELTTGREVSEAFALKNTGNADAEYFFLLTQVPSNGSVENKLTGPFHPSTRRMGPKALLDGNAKRVRHQIEMPKVPLKTNIEIVGMFDVQQEGIWGLAINQDNGDFWLGATAGVGGTVDGVYRYDVDGNPTEDEIDNASFSAAYGADITYNHRTGMLWQAEAIGTNCIHEMDPVSKLVTGKKICPAFGVSQRGLTYDPITNTFYSGSWVDGLIHQFRVDGSIMRSINVGLSVSGLALNPISNTLFVMVSDDDPAFDVVLLDANTAELAPVSAFNFPQNQDIDDDGELDDLIGNYEQVGVALDCQGTLWTPSRRYDAIVGVATGETGVCDWKALPWLKIDQGGTGTVAANDSSDVELVINGAELSTGSYQAQLVVSSYNTPYEDVAKLVTVNVVEPSYGSLGIVNRSVSVKNGSVATITVQRLDGADYAVSADYTTADGIAIAGTNYTRTSGTLTWADGDVAPKTIDISTFNTKQGSDLGFSLILSDAKGGATIGSNSAAILVEKDKNGGSLSVGILLLFALAGLVRRKYVVQ